MFSLIIAFVISFIATMLIIRYEHLHGHLSHDFDLRGPQKFHTLPVPRIGGVSIALGLTFAMISSIFEGAPKAPTFIFILASAIPCFLIGLLEDITKKIGVKTRLLFTATSTLLLIYLTQSSITRLSIPGADWLLGATAISVIFTCFAVTGLVNAYNIIDGFNGLASMVALICLGAIAYVGFIVGDRMIASLAFVMVGAIAGFFVWNYPRGLIFLGDGGSYLIGFWVGALSVLLVSRNQSVSPWFALLVNGYPIFETLFTIYRRLIHRRGSPGAPDAIHFHTLLFRRVLRFSTQNSSYIANAKTSPFIWLLTVFTVLPAIKWWYSDIFLIFSFICFSLLYIFLYFRIIRFKTPRIFKMLS